MTRQLLTLFALLTGLAAVGAPLHASEAEALACEIEASCEKQCSDGELNAGLNMPDAQWHHMVPTGYLHNWAYGLAAIAPRTLIQIDRAAE